jgi:hypothetical protein
MFVCDNVVDFVIAGTEDVRPPIGIGTSLIRHALIGAHASVAQRSVVKRAVTTPLQTFALVVVALARQHHSVVFSLCLSAFELSISKLGHFIAIIINLLLIIARER